MLTTNNPEFNERLRLWRQHSMSISDSVRHGSKRVKFEDYPELGYNYRLTDIQAAIGRAQLRRLQSIIEKRRFLAFKYLELFKTCDIITLPQEPDWARSNWQSFCIRLNGEVKQNSIMQSLLEKGIATRRGIMCAHLEPAYLNEPWHTGNGKKDRNKLYHSERSRDRAILLPLFHDLRECEQCYIMEKLIEFVGVT